MLVVAGGRRWWRDPVVCDVVMVMVVVFVHNRGDGGPGRENQLHLKEPNPSNRDASYVHEQHAKRFAQSVGFYG